MTPAEAEAERILAEYKRRDAEIGRDFYSLTRSANLFAWQGQQRALLQALARSNALPLHDQRILDVGCGRGQWLGMLEDFGASRGNFSGTDLNAGRIQEAQTNFPGADLRVGDATKLPWPDATFDLVLQATMFTSILDDTVRVAIATEMRRVVKKTGLIVWYDFRINNPRNPNVRGISKKELERLFLGCSIQLELVTLAPPIARRIVPRAFLVATALERIRILNTHYFGVIRT